MPPQGAPLYQEVGERTYPQVGQLTLDPRNAMAETLRAFLRCAVFLRGGGDGGEDLPFQLAEVYPHWIEYGTEIEYPSASIVDAGEVPYQAHNLVPSALEDTWDRDAGTVLWKLAEAVADFQVDYWCGDDPTREAIAAALPGLFNPSEERAGVVLSGDPRYFCIPVRATLMAHQRTDDTSTAPARERRLMTRVTCEIDVVQLRKAVELKPRMVLRDGFPESC